MPNLQDGTEGGLGALAASGVGEGLSTALPAAAASVALASAQSSHGTAAILGSGSSVLVGGDMTALTAADMSMCGGGEAASAALRHARCVSDRATRPLIGISGLEALDALPHALYLLPLALHHL